MINPKSVVVVLVVAVLAFAGVNAQAAPGDMIPYTQGTFVDNVSGKTYTFQIQANEYPLEAGVGDVYFTLNAPRLNLTTVGKGWNPPDNPPDRPLASIMNGMAGNQAVAIGERVVEISAHAFVHSDAPNDIVFIGTVTVDVRAEIKAKQIRVVISSPKGKTKLEGKFITTVLPD